MRRALTRDEAETLGVIASRPRTIHAMHEALGLSGEALEYSALLQSVVGLEDLGLIRARAGYAAAYRYELTDDGRAAAGKLVAR